MSDMQFLNDLIAKPLLELENKYANLKSTVDSQNASIINKLEELEKSLTAIAEKIECESSVPRKQENKINVAENRIKKLEETVEELKLVKEELLKLKGIPETVGLFNYDMVKVKKNIELLLDTTKHDRECSVLEVHDCIKKTNDLEQAIDILVERIDGTKKLILSIEKEMGLRFEERVAQVMGETERYETKLFSVDNQIKTQSVNIYSRINDLEKTIMEHISIVSEKVNTLAEAVSEIETK